MSVIATYNGEAFANVRGWSSRRTEQVTFGSKQVKSYRVEYTLLVQYSGNTTAANRATDLAQLVTKIEEPEKRFQIAMDGTDIIDINPSDTGVTRGPFARFEVPETDAFKVGYNVPARLTVWAILDPQTSGTIQAREEATSYSVNDEGYTTRTIKGEIKVAEGNSASGQLTTVTPAALTGYDRSISYEHDDLDLEMTYTFTDVEQEESNRGSAGPGSTWSIQAAASDDGMETWVLAGTLKYEKGKKPNDGDVTNLMKRHFPSGVKITNRSTTKNTVENSLSFQVTAQRSFGKGGIFRHTQTVVLRQTKTRRVFLSTSPSGKDVRQDYARPVVEVVQSGTSWQHGGYPAAPALLLKQDDQDMQELTYGQLLFDPTDGTIVAGQISWNYRYRVLNAVEAGQFGQFQKIVKQPRQLADDHPLKGKTHRAKAA